MMFNRKDGAFRPLLPCLKEPETELDYLRSKFESTKSYAKSLVLILAALFLSFALADRSAISDDQIFFTVFGIRLFFFLSVLILHPSFEQINSHAKLIMRLSAYKILASVSFLAIFYVYESPNFFLQAFGVLSLILSFYLVPNNWVNMLAILLALTSGFSFLALHKMSELIFSDWLAVTLHLHLAVAFVSLASYQMHCHRRMQYLKEKQLAKISVTDETTGLYNKKKLHQKLNYWLNEAIENDMPLSVAVFDVDNLKVINDSYGHLVGDKALMNVGQIISETVGDTGIVARWGGDEFVAVLPYFTKEASNRLIEKLDRIIPENVKIYNQTITCSIGVATFQKNDSFDSFLHRADLNMYSDKKVKSS